MEDLPFCVYRHSEMYDNEALYRIQGWILSAGRLERAVGIECHVVMRLVS